MRQYVAAFGWAALTVSVAAQEAAPPATAPPAAAAAPTPAAAPVERRFAELSLTLRFPPELHLVEQPPPTEAQVRAAWLGKLAQSELRVRMLLAGRAEYGFDEPNQMLEIIGADLADPMSGGDPAFHFDEIVYLPGQFGEVDYAALATSSEMKADLEGPSQFFRLGGLLDATVYVVELRARPPLGADDTQVVRQALGQCAVYEGPQRDPKWTDAEAEAYWEQQAPDEVQKDLEVLRSPHYIILTNSSGGKSFAKKMEECYAAIRKVYAFEEVAGRRLMPVLLFRTADQYYDFFPKSLGSTVEAGKRTGGIFSGDCYATWYEAPGDPVHIHEATHQVFGKRLGLTGGGSWFQEGVAEYMSTKDNERGAAARSVKKGRAKPLREFMAIESLLFSSKEDDKSGADEAGSQYELAALFVEFMRESKFGKAKFTEYIRAVGAVPRGNVRAIEAAVKRVYGVGLAELEAQFVEYCKKR